MIKGSQHRTSEHAIDSVFIDRWSARAMTGEPLAEAELMVLFEAARWAPSSMNFQPWRMLYAVRDSPYWPLFLGLLTERNQSWARQAGALVLFVSKTKLDDGRPCVTHSFDTGAAWENFALQAASKHLVVHGMQGFDYARARRELNIPEEYHVDAMAAVGKPGDKTVLPEGLQARELPSNRRALSEIAREGRFSFD